MNTPHFLNPIFYQWTFRLFLTNFNSAAVEAVEHTILGIDSFVFFGYIPKGEIIGSFGNSTFCFYKGKSRSLFKITESVFVSASSVI